MPTDEQLLAELRAGRREAYEELWTRHIGPAMRLARRVAPLHAEDLVSESFALVLRQVTVVGGGPVHSFRSYLFAVMRNLAYTWQREGQPLVFVAEFDEVAAEAADELVDDDPATMLRAFRALPHRWQVVLWMMEVERAPRSAVTAELRIRPNAVSALLRRAKAGLRRQWLWEHVPAAMREDSAHAARLLPDLLMGRLGERERARVGEHLAGCASCREVHGQLRELAGGMVDLALGGLGLAALGAGAHAMSGSAAPVSGATAASLLSGGAGAVASSGGVAGGAAGAGAALGSGLGLKVASLAVSLVVVAEILGGAPAPPLPSARADRAVADPVASTPRERIVADDPSARTDAGEAAPVPPAGSDVRPTPPSAGDPRFPVEGSPFVDLWQPASPGAGEQPSRPAAPPAGDPGAVPRPGEEPVAGRPEPLVVQQTSVADAYIAPELSGTADPANTVAIDVGDAVYGVRPAASGEWSLDLSALELPYGEHRALAWQYTDVGLASDAVETGFRIEPLVLDGFTTFTRFDALSAERDGWVFTVAGPAGGTVCLDADTGQSVRIPLSDEGYAVRRLRFLGVGTYVLTVSTCAEGRYGPATVSTVEVEEDGFTPFGGLGDRSVLVDEP